MTLVTAKAFYYDAPPVAMQRRGLTRRKLPWLLAVLLVQCGGRSISGSGSGSNAANSAGDSSATHGAGGSTTTMGANSTGQGGVSTSSVAGTSSTVSTTGGLVASPIPFTDGWALLEDNTLGIQGALYVAADSSDGGNSLIEGNFAGPQVCASGIAGQVLPGPDGIPLYATYWGALMGFNLVQEVDSDMPLPYDATLHGIVAFGFDVTGFNPLPPGGVLRFNVRVFGDSSIYCTEIWTPGPQMIHMSDVRQNCWEGNPSAPTPDLTRLEALHWQYATNDRFGYGFDLCIENLVAWVF